MGNIVSCFSRPQTNAFAADNSVIPASKSDKPWGANVAPERLSARKKPSKKSSQEDKNLTAAMKLAETIELAQDVVDVLNGINAAQRSIAVRRKEFPER